MVVNSMSYATYDSYKDSGVDWLGAIPSDWQSKKLGILLTEFSKKNNPNLPLLSITRELGVITRDMDDQESNHNFIPDDLSGYKLLKEGQFGMNKMKAWQGSYGISKYTGIVSPAYYVFDVSNEIYPNFFNIAIRSKFYVDFFGSASDGVRIGQWDLNKTRMKEIPFIFPSLEQQKKIYEFLSKKIKQIDQAIALKQQQIEKLGEYKQIVIQNAVTKGLNPNAPMKDSGVEWIGDIPEHWEIDKLKNILSSVSIKNHPNLPLLSITREKGVIERDIEDQESNHNFIPDDLSGYKLLKKGQFGMNKMKAWQGSYGVSDFTGIVSPAYYIFDINEKLDKNFFSLAIRSKFYVGYFASASDGVRIGQWDLNKTRMKEIPFIIPSIEEQKAIYEFSLTINQQVKDAIKKYQTQIDRLKEYKNILINQAVTGKIKI